MATYQFNVISLQLKIPESHIIKRGVRSEYASAICNSEPPPLKKVNFMKYYEFNKTKED